MDDTELTKKAIEELLSVMNDGNEMGGLPAERKKNPLGKPNKRFWQRTMNSVVKYNKRQIDRNYRRSQRKLRELDAKQKKQVGRQTRRNHEKIQRHSQTESSHEYLSGVNEGNNLNIEKKHRNLKNIKRKRKKKKQKSSSSSSSSSNSSNSSASSSSSDSESSGVTIPSKGKKYKNSSKTSRRSFHSDNEEDEEELYSEIPLHETNIGYYLDPQMAYTAMAYGHINHLLHQQQLMQQQTIKNELEESVDIPSDLSISYHSPESSLNISLHSSSAEEDESGILTFKLLSSDEERQSPIPKNINAKRKDRNENHNIVTLVESDDTDQSSVKSYISLDSATSQIPNSQNNEILLLSSSTSDCDDLELIETISESKPKETSLENIEEQYNNAQIEYETKTSVDKIENISHTNQNNLHEKHNETEIRSKLVENEEINKQLKAEQNVQVGEPINENEIKRQFGNAGELDKNINVTRDHDGKINDENRELNKDSVEIQENYIKTKTIVDKELENIEDYKGKVKGANEEINKSRVPETENHTNTTMIDLTEE